MSSRSVPRSSLAAVALAVLLALTTVVVLSVSPAGAVPGSALPHLSTAPVVRIGFFANLTHAPALVAQELKLFEKQLGAEGTKVQYVLFNAGPAAVEAMKGGAIDVAYIGPNPAITGYASTNGALLRVVSGVASGGAQLIVKPGIDKVADLKGKMIATPQLGNTQDVALRSWLAKQGFKTSTTGAGDVTVIPTENATTLSLFQRGQIAGAWVPEPWASRLVLEGGGKVFLDERSLWPQGKFVTTNIIAATSFLSKYPGTVRSVVHANADAIDYIHRNPSSAVGLVQKELTKWTGRPLSAAVVQRSWGNVDFTWDPLPQSLSRNAASAQSVGLLTLGPSGLGSIYDLRLLNAVLVSDGDRTVSAGGLGLQ